MLKETFSELLTNYARNSLLTEELWNEIEENYSSMDRHYHTLTHLEKLLIQLIEVKSKIQNWEVILFSMYYHDLIYDSQKSDNEEKSAELAVLRMKKIGVPDELIVQCKEQILATKSHLFAHQNDTNYFTDADLSILGQSWEEYSTYFKNVRKEYSIYPDLIYIPERKKVLNHFLMMDSIFKTAYFQSKFETQAKLNLRKELALL